MGGKKKKAVGPAKAAIAHLKWADKKRKAVGPVKAATARLERYRLGSW